MTIEFNSISSGITNYIGNKSLLGSILNNVFFTAITLTILLIMMVLFLYPTNSKNRKSNGSNPSNTLVKLFVYLFLTNATVLALHYSITTKKCKEESDLQQSSEFITNINKKGGNV